MAGSFDSPTIHVRPLEDGSVSVKGEGTESDPPVEIVVFPGETKKKKKERPSRPVIPPPWIAYAMWRGNRVAELGSGEVDLEKLLGDIEVDQLKVFTHSDALSEEELEPLVDVAREHRLEIEVHLDKDG